VFYRLANILDTRLQRLISMEMGKCHYDDSFFRDNCSILMFATTWGENGKGVSSLSAVLFVTISSSNYTFL